MGRPTNAEIAARQAAADSPADAPADVQDTPTRPRQPIELVEVTVTKFGEGKVSTGEHVAGDGDIYASRGEKIRVSSGIAALLEAKGLAEAD